jgi:pimeloyl-ACP methyl ester carboxylesterase
MADFDPAIESFPKLTNRHGLQVFVKLLLVPGSQRNVYLAHGFSDVHDTAHMRALTGAYVVAGYNVIVWDATHSWGRSEGSSEKASFFYHHEDLEDVVEWSRSQPWHQERFALAGHSLGGMVAGTYAASHPRQVVNLALVSPVVSGRALRRRVCLPVWLWRRRRRHLLEFLRSAWSYDLLRSARRLTMPVLIVGAGRDIIIPPRLLRRLYGAIPGPTKRLEIVAGARHGLDADWEMERLASLIVKWLTIKA